MKRPDTVRDIARHGFGRGLNPPIQKYSPQNKMTPISLFGLGLMFFARCVSKKEPAAGGIFFSL